MDCVPVTGLLPDQAPLAKQYSAFAADQCNVALAPLVSVLGVAVSVTVGSTDFTETVAVCVAVPFGPVQTNVNVSLVFSAGVVNEPVTALVPDQSPVATQDVALVLVHVRAEVLPALMVLGLAVSETLGADPGTVTVTDCVALPPMPSQVSSNAVVTVSALVV